MSINIGDEFAYDVMGKIIKISEALGQLNYYNKKHYERIFCEQILLLAKYYNFTSQYGYNMFGKDLKNLNVIWKGKESEIAAFIIKESLKNDSLYNLMNSNITYKFWIYYGKSEIPYASKIVNEHCIHIIRLHI